MGADGRPHRGVVGRIRALPVDLLLVLAAVIVVDVLVLLLPTAEPRMVLLRALLSLPFVLFLPGYALVAALFPEAGPERAAGGSATNDRERGFSDRIDGATRLALSVGASIAIAPLIGILLDYSVLGVRPAPVTLSLSAFTAIAALVGIFRRQALLETERYSVFGRRRPRSTVGAESRSWADPALTIAVVLAAVLVCSSVVYVAAVPRGGEQITELSLLTRNETSGNLTAQGYPTEFVRGEAKPLVLSIENHEGRPTNYTVLVVLQRIEARNGSAAVVEQRRLNRFQVRVGPGQSRLRPHTVAPTMNGTRLRLAYLLYRGGAPANPTVTNAYREVHLWIGVSAPSPPSDSSAPNVSNTLNTPGTANATNASATLNASGTPSTAGASNASGTTPVSNTTSPRRAIHTTPS